MTIKGDTPPLAGTLDALRALWNTAKESHPTIVLSAQQALRAIDSEVQADYLLTQVAPQDLLDIYTLCEAVQALADALELGPTRVLGSGWNVNNRNPTFKSKRSIKVALVSSNDSWSAIMHYKQRCTSFAKATTSLCALM